MAIVKAKAIGAMRNKKNRCLVERTAVMLMVPKRGHCYFASLPNSGYGTKVAFSLLLKLTR